MKYNFILIFFQFFYMKYKIVQLYIIIYNNYSYVARAI